MTEYNINFDRNLNKMHIATLGAFGAFGAFHAFGAFWHRKFPQETVLGAYRPRPSANYAEPNSWKPTL